MTEHDASMKRFQQWWTRAVRSGYGTVDVSWLHRNSVLGIWRLETLRAFVWGGLLPLTIGLGALVHPAALLGALVYILQICRIAVRDRATSQHSWLRALFSTLDKFAAFQGILTFLWRKSRQDAATLIEYK